MQKPEIWKLVLAHLAPSKTDPSSSDWRSYINRYIVPEVRQENMRFFGSTDDHESQYPGLDYSNPAHRLRLRAFPHHHQLFAIFDKLRLTESELNSLCKWHGTKRAKEDFERKHHFKITDTTWDGVHPYRYLEPTVTLRGGEDVNETPLGNDFNMVHAEDEEMEDTDEDDEDGDEDEDEDEDVSGVDSEDELQQSVGVELNERLRANAQADVEARARGEVVTMDAEWEQWLKEAAERGLPTASLGIPPSGLSDPAIMQQWVREISNDPTAQHYMPQHPASVSALQTFLDNPSLETAGTTSGPIVEGH